jgi:hypothetical protein
MRRGPAVLTVLLLVTALACGGTPETSADQGAPLSLLDPEAPDPPGTSGSTGGGIADQIRPSATPDYLRHAGSATRTTSTGRITMVAAVVGGSGHEGRTTELSVLEGSWDNEAGNSRLRVDPTGFVRAGGTGIGALFGGPMEMIQIGDVQYIKLGGAAGEGWMRSTGANGGAVRSVFDRFALPDVGAFLRALACAAPVTDAGTETIDGVETNHYRVESDADRLRTCVRQEPSAQGLLDQLGDAEEAQVDVWIDQGDLVRRLVITADERALGAGLAGRFPAASSVMTMTLDGFGEPVSIEAPPDDEITDGGLPGLDGLLSGGGSGTSGSGTDPLEDLSGLFGG